MSTKKSHYSGDNSIEFWDRINKLQGRDHEALFHCGILLQNMESSVLTWLDNAEKLEASNIKTSSKTKAKKKR